MVSFGVSGVAISVVDKTSEKMHTSSHIRQNNWKVCPNTKGESDEEAIRNMGVDPCSYGFMSLCFNIRAEAGTGYFFCTNTPGHSGNHASDGDGE